MADFNLKRKAIDLRIKGHTYSEIKNILHVHKSTLTRWIGQYPLTEPQLLLLRRHKDKNKQLAIEKTRQIKKFKREQEFKQICTNEKIKLSPLNIKEKYISGLMLYWGEGVKGGGSTVSLCNTDPAVLKYYVSWLEYCLLVPKKNMKVMLHLYSDMNINEMISYWSNELGLSPRQFIKPYIKQTKSISVDHAGFSHGTCGVYIYNAVLKRKIMAGIKVLGDEALS